MPSCRYCSQPGHYKPSCPALAADKARAKEIETGIATNVANLTATKNPFHWERLTKAREAVRHQLEAALGVLSPQAKAAPFINAALKELERCR